LDGGRILTGLLPIKYAFRFAQIERYGFIIVLALMFLQLLKYWMIPVMLVAENVLRFVVSPLTIFLH
jgi:Zn-dependent protease